MHFKRFKIDWVFLSLFKKIRIIFQIKLMWLLRDHRKRLMTSHFFPFIFYFSRLNTISNTNGGFTYKVRVHYPCRKNISSVFWIMKHILLILFSYFFFFMMMLHATSKNPQNITENNNYFFYEYIHPNVSNTATNM